MKIFIIPLLLFFNSVSADEIITIAASDSIPPYVMIDHAHESKLSGLQVEIVDAAFSAVGIKTKWQTMPNNRLIIHYAKNNVDAALNLPDVSRATSNYSSDVLVYYRNCVIGNVSLKNSWRTSSKDLKILGFQTAKAIYADSFPTKYLENNSNYIEVPSQKTLAYHAVNARADLILSDALVFSYYAQSNWPAQLEKSGLACLHELKLPRHIGFKDKAIRDKFNKGLEQIKANGLYDSINDKYSKLFSQLQIFQSYKSQQDNPIAIK
tara:strand:+ start:3030 stop:3827 length:798 start_codon:yes stop_codon:yes gene_type:complete